LPACITAEISDSAECKVCQKKVPGLDALLKHGREHALEGNLMCAFCGETFTSAVSLRLHQLVWRAPGPEEDHLNLGGDCLGQGGGRCPLCGLQVAELEQHRVIQCASRSPVVKSRISSLVREAEEAGLDPMVVVSQEVEASLAHLRRLDILAWAPEGIEAAEGILKLFPLWEKVVERLDEAGGLGEALQRVATELGRSEWESLEQDSVLVTDKPASSVLERLEAELGWGCADEVPPGVEQTLRGLQAQLASVQ